MNIIPYEFLKFLNALVPFLIVAEYSVNHQPSLQPSQLFVFSGITQNSWFPESFWPLAALFNDGEPQFGVPNSQVEIKWLIQLWSCFLCVAGRWPGCSWNVKYSKSSLPTRSRRSIYVLHENTPSVSFFISRKRCHIPPHQVFIWQETPNSETLPAKGTHFLSSKWLQTHLHWQVTTYILLWCFCSFENVNKNLMWKKNNFFQICVPMSPRQLMLSYKIK